MSTLTDWAMSMVQPIIVRAMTSLGLSIITFKGVDTAFQQARTYLVDAVNSFPATALNLMGLWGLDTGLAVVLGAMSFSLTLWALRKSFSFFGLGSITS